MMQHQGVLIYSHGNNKKSDSFIRRRQPPHPRTEEQKEQSDAKFSSRIQDLVVEYQSSPSYVACNKMTAQVAGGGRGECCYAMCWIKAGQRHPPPHQTGTERGWEGCKIVWKLLTQNRTSDRFWAGTERECWIFFISFFFFLLRCIFTTFWTCMLWW